MQHSEITARAIKAQMERLGWDYKKLSKETGTSLERCYAITNGKNGISFQYAQKLCEVFNMKLSEFICSGEPV